MKEFLGLLLTGRVAGTQASCRRGVASRITLALLLIALIPLATIGFLSYFYTKDTPNLRSQRPGTGGQNMGGERACKGSTFTFTRPKKEAPSP